MTNKAEKPQEWNDRREEELCEALLTLKSAKDAHKFLVDLCTPAEIRALADRWRVARLLAADVSYRKIQELTSVSTATVTRVARALTQGDGGYRKVLEKMGKLKEEKANA